MRVACVVCLSRVSRVWLAYTSVYTDTRTAQNRAKIERAWRERRADRNPFGSKSSFASAAVRNTTRS